MRKSKATSPAEVIEVLKRTAIHTLNVYGDSDPDGQRILQGLSAVAQAVAHACGLDETALDGYNAALAQAASSDVPADAERVSTTKMKKAHRLVRKLIRGESDPIRLTEAADYLRDFWRTANAGC